MLFVHFSYAFEPLSTFEQPTVEEESADEKEKIMLGLLRYLSIMLKF